MCSEHIVYFSNFYYLLFQIYVGLGTITAQNYDYRTRLGLLVFKAPCILQSYSQYKTSRG